MGKTHLAVALGVGAVRHGANVYFITIPDLVEQLARDVQENRLSEHLPSLRHPTLLILGEMGYLPLDQLATSFLFQLLSKRYTKGSIIVTSNKSYAEWGSVFYDDVAAAAVRLGGMNTGIWPRFTLVFRHLARILILRLTSSFPSTRTLLGSKVYQQRRAPYISMQTFCSWERPRHTPR